MFVRISQGSPNFAGFVGLIQRTDRASLDALTAQRTGDLAQRNVSSGGHPRLESAVYHAKGGYTLDFFTDCHTASAENTLSLITNDRRIGVVNAGLGISPLEAHLADTKFFCETLQFAVQVAYAS